MAARPAHSLEKVEVGLRKRTIEALMGYTGLDERAAMDLLQVIRAAYGLAFVLSGESAAELLTELRAEVAEDSRVREVVAVLSGHGYGGSVGLMAERLVKAGSAAEIETVLEGGRGIVDVLKVLGYIDKRS